MKNDFVKLVENTLASKNDINVILKTFRKEMFEIVESFVLNEAVDVVGQTIMAATKTIESFKNKITNSLKAVKDDENKPKKEEQILNQAKSTIKSTAQKYANMFDQQSRKDDKPADVGKLKEFSDKLTSALEKETISDFLSALPSEV